MMPFHDECVAVGGEDEAAVGGDVALYPYAALAAVDEVLLGLVFVVEVSRSEPRSMRS